MKLTRNVLIISGLTILAACTSEPVEETQETTQSCFYSYNEGATTLEWTSYKTNDKLPVKGGFNNIEVSSESAEDPKEVIKSIEFKIETASVETSDTSRNRKVGSFFFGTINTEYITGRVASLNDDGTAAITINMNGIDYDVVGDYTLEDKLFSWEATIDVISWNALGGIDALNEECKDLHTGADGESKLWSEVALKLTTVLSSDCD